MGIEEVFNERLREWNAHCAGISKSSWSQDYINCDAYRELVRLGPQILPFVREALEPGRKGPSIPDPVCGTLLAEIVGDQFQIPKAMQGKINEIRVYCRDWLDQNMGKYLPKE